MIMEEKIKSNYEKLEEEEFHKKIIQEEEIIFKEKLIEIQKYLDSLLLLNNIRIYKEYNRFDVLLFNNNNIIVEICIYKDRIYLSLNGYDESVNIYNNSMYDKNYDKLNNAFIKNKSNLCDRLLKNISEMPIFRSEKIQNFLDENI